MAGFNFFPRPWPQSRLVTSLSDAHPKSAFENEPQVKRLTAPLRQENISMFRDVARTRPVVSNFNENGYAPSRITNKHNNSRINSAKIKNIRDETIAFRLLASFRKPRGSRFDFTAVSAICTPAESERASERPPHQHLRA